MTPPHRKFKKDAPDWYQEMRERQCKAHSSRRIRVEHGIANLKNWRSLARRLGRRAHISDTVQAVAGLLSHSAADLNPRRRRRAPGVEEPSASRHLPCTSSLDRLRSRGSGSGPCIEAFDDDSRGSPRLQPQQQSATAQRKSANSDLRKAG